MQESQAKLQAQLDNQSQGSHLQQQQQQGVPGARGTAPAHIINSVQGPTIPQDASMGSRDAQGHPLCYLQPTQPGGVQETLQQAEAVSLLPQFLPVVDATGREIGFLQGSTMTTFQTVPIEGSSLPQQQQLPTSLQQAHFQQPNALNHLSIPVLPQQPVPSHLSPRKTSSQSALPSLLPPQQINQPALHFHSQHPVGMNMMQNVRSPQQQQQQPPVQTRMAQMPAEVAVVCGGVRGLLSISSFTILCECAECLSKGPPESRPQFRPVDWEPHCGEFT